MLALTAFPLSDIGQVRTTNQDYYAADEAHQVFIAADGLGGHAAGEEASRIATESAHAYLTRQLEERPDADIHLLLRDTCDEAHECILAAQRDDPETLGMATTFVIAFYRNGLLTIAHVGDCRAYRLRGAQLQRLTTDHALVAQLVEKKLITEEKARTHPQASEVDRILGGVDIPSLKSNEEEDKTHEAEVTVTNVWPGDMFILCTDGLTRTLYDEGIAQVMQRNTTTRGTAIELLREALEHGGPDNITVVAMKAEEKSPAQLRGLRTPRTIQAAWEMITGDGRRSEEKVTTTAPFRRDEEKVTTTVPSPPPTTTTTTTAGSHVSA